MKTQRNFALDLVRSIAILLVFSNHLLTNILKADLGPFWYLASLGVDIFFGLSGFLIGGILINMAGDAKAWITPQDTFRFLIRRIFRTAPLYFFLLIVNFLVCRFLLKNVHTFDWHFLFWLQNFTHHPPSFFGESWSLCIEEWFYLSYSILLCLFTLSVRKWNLAFLDKVLVFTVAYIILFTVIRSAFSDFTYADSKVVAFRMDSIAYGVLMAVLNKKRILDNYRNQVGITGGLMLLFGIFIFLKSPFPFLHNFHYTLSGLGVAVCVWYIHKSSLSMHRFSKQIRFISKTSYSIYLINLIAIYLLLHFSQVQANVYFVFLLGLVVIIGFSYMTYKFVELPFLRFREMYFPERRMSIFSE